MLRRLTFPALSIWLFASFPLALMGQDWRGGQSAPLFIPSIDRGTGITMLPAEIGMTSTSIQPNRSITQSPYQLFSPSQLSESRLANSWLIPSVFPIESATPMPSATLAATLATALPIRPESATGIPITPESATAIPTTPESAVQPPDVGLNWSLGDYGPSSPLVAQDLNPPGQHLGWYAGFDIGVMKAHLDTHLSTPQGFAGPTGGPITIGASSLDWLGAPEFSLGYRFSQGAGELRLTYRLVDTSGTEAIPGTDANGNPAQLHSSLNVNTLDFDYISPEYLSEGQDIARLLFRDLRAGIGLRAAAAYFDNRASGFPVTDTHMSSAFGGVGPRMFVELHQDLGRPDFQFYSRLSGTGLLGPILQQFDQTSMEGGTSNFGAYDTHNKNIGMGIFQFETGFSWEPEAWGRRFRFTVAYSWERWWSFGRTDSSDAELTLQGAVIRAEYRY